MNDIYKDFRIKAYSYENNVNTLVGLPWLVKVFGDDRAQHFLKVGVRSMDKGCQKYVFKRYRGYTLTIYLR